MTAKSLRPHLPRARRGLPPHLLRVKRGQEVYSGRLLRPPTKFRLVPCPMDAADAFILVPPPGTYVPTPTNYAARSGNGQGILLMGKALQHLRRSPPRPLAKGARLHPYRIVRGELPARGENAAPPSRRASVVSITSFSASS